MEEQNPTSAPIYCTNFKSVEEIVTAMENGETINIQFAPPLPPTYHPGEFGTVSDQAPLAREFLLNLPDWNEARFAKEMLDLDSAIAALADRGEDWWEVWTKLFSINMHDHNAALLVVWLDRAGYGSTNFTDVANWAEGYRASLTQDSFS